MKKGFARFRSTVRLRYSCFLLRLKCLKLSLLKNTVRSQVSQSQCNSLCCHNDKFYQSFFPLGCLGNVDRKRGFGIGAQRSVEHAPSDAWWSYSCFQHLTNFSIYFREQTDGYHRQGKHISSCLILLARFCQCLLAFGFNFRFHFSVKIDGKIEPSGFFRICLKILYPSIQSFLEIVIGASAILSPG